MNNTTKMFISKAKSFYDDVLLKNPTKENLYKTICLFRAGVVRIINEYTTTRDYARYFVRVVKTCNSKSSDTTNIAILNPYAENLTLLEYNIVEFGGNLCYLLDKWQQHGATQYELATICNASKSSWKKQGISEDENFSVIAGAYCADYKEVGEYIKDTPNAPLTTALKIYMLNYMMFTELGNQVGEIAFDKLFSENSDEEIIDN